MEKIIKKYNKIEENVLVFSLVLNVIVIFIQVIMRTVFNKSLAFSEELSRYIFIWQIWLGASIAFANNEHINVDIIFSIFKSEKSKKIINLIVNIILILFNIFLITEGFKLLGSMNARGTTSSGMRLPLVYVYASLPISSIIVLIRLIWMTYCDLFNNKESEV